MLHEQQCHPVKTGQAALSRDHIDNYLTKLSEQWQLDYKEKCIDRDFHFDDYCYTMSFVNAVAWIAQQQDHHPELQISYNHCKVSYTTHTINGLSENDFICAARIDQLPF